MIKDIKKTKKKILINGVSKKVEYEVYLLIRNQHESLLNHSVALCKYAQIYEENKNPSDSEEILYEYCMQLEEVQELLKQLKDEKENNSKS